jgi:hypothetical protein
VAKQQFGFIIVEVHAVSFAVTEHVAIGALAFVRPCPVAEWLELLIPDVDEAVFVDIAVVKIINTLFGLT